MPPRIHYVSHSGPLEVLQGATVKMECRASGNPVPTVAWTRKNNVLPSGERSVSGLSLVIQHADRHSAGQYQCSADNGVGQPDTRHITLNVLCKYRQCFVAKRWDCRFEIKVCPRSFKQTWTGKNYHYLFPCNDNEKSHLLRQRFPMFRGNHCGEILHVLSL